MLVPMTIPVVLVVALLSAVGGAVVALLISRGRAAQLGLRAEHLILEVSRLDEERSTLDRRLVDERVELTRRLDEAQQAVAAAREELARRESDLEHERSSAAEKLALVEQAKAQLADTFGSLSAQALERNNRSFLELAGASLGQTQVEARGDLEQRRQAVEHLVAPLLDSLGKVEGQLQSLEVSRQHAYASLTEQVRSLSAGQDRLRSETANLVTALRTPSVRGRWGEIQLRRVVEMAGMVAHCDFVEQATAATADGGRRADVVVRLPGGKHLVIDAKVPLQAYLAAHEASEEDVRFRLLDDHARQLRVHVDALSAKAYWAQFTPSPDFVVLFVPGDPLLNAALEHDPSLMEHAIANNVLLATPTTLIALLRSVAYGWRQEALGENARKICELGSELYRRLSTMGDHVAKLGRSLDGAVEAYNRTVGSLESRVLSSARKFTDLEVGEGELAQPSQVEKAPRVLSAAELVEPPALAPADDGRTSTAA